MRLLRGTAGLLRRLCRIIFINQATDAARVLFSKKVGGGLTAEALPAEGGWIQWPGTRCSWTGQSPNTWQSEQSHWERGCGVPWELESDQQAQVPYFLRFTWDE
jgi:hypothetical protein